MTSLLARLMITIGLTRRDAVILERLHERTGNTDCWRVVDIRAAPSSVLGKILAQFVKPDRNVDAQ